MSAIRPLSVVVPVCDGAATLARALAAILNSDLRRDDFELIVVDDASTDGSAELAARYADVVVRLSGRRSGPAYARNRGAELAQGEIVAFVDADALVRQDTLPQMLQLFVDHPALDAVSASHDNAPDADNFVSQYWNLLLRFGERGHLGTGGNFASPCAAMRRHALLSAGMFDEWRFNTAPLEGIELGKRLEESGCGVLSSSDIGISGLRRWTLIQLCRAVWNRAALVARSLGYQSTRAAVPSEVVFTLSHAVAPTFAVLCIASFSGAFVLHPNASIKTAIVLLGAIGVNLPLNVFFARERGLLFALVATPVHLLMESITGLALCVGWLMRDAVGDHAPNAAIQAYAEVGVETWPPVPRVSGG
jgi:hypothetical protein